MEKRFETAVNLAKMAGIFLIENCRDIGKISETAHDVKLQQDIDSERIILGCIDDSFPCDGYISEERGKKKGTSGYNWIIDPLDGTANYSKGLLHCCISISCHSKDSGFGVVYDFFNNELFTGMKNGGAFLNGKRISVSAVKELKDAFLCMNLMPEPEHFKSGIELFAASAYKVKKVRMLGAAALDICYVAAGRVDIFMETGLKIWDTSAGSIILQEAGGMYSEIDIETSKIVLAGNGLLSLEELWKSREKR